MPPTNYSSYAWEEIDRVDSSWQLRSAFAVLSMQSGFALLETGYVKAKNVANLKVKNVVDLALGGLAFWLFGFGLAFGRPATSFSGCGYFLLTHVDHKEMGKLYTNYFYHFCFASTATTIVSGAVAERITIGAYATFSFVNTITYAIPASWAWNKGYGWLDTLSFYDFAGTCVVHGNGGASALVAAIMIGPRLQRWENPKQFGMTSPVTALTGTLLLWWAWFAFNCGSTLGSIGEGGHLWKINALVAVNTLNGSVGGACFGLFASMVLKKGKVDVTWLISSILGGLVAITGICSVTSPLECLIIGAVGAAIAIATTPLLEFCKVDDPVGAVPVHFFAAIWGTLSVGLFGKNDEFNTLQRNGLFHGGGFYLLGVQALGLVCICVWSAVTTFVFLFVINKLIGIRMSKEDEEMGADICEHGIERADGLRGMVAKEFDENSPLGKMYSKELRRKNTLAILHSGQPNFLQNNNAELAIIDDSGIVSEELKEEITAAANGRIPSPKENGSAVHPEPQDPAQLDPLSTRPVTAKPRSSHRINSVSSMRSRLRGLRLRTGLRRQSSVQAMKVIPERDKETTQAGLAATSPVMGLPNLPEVSH